MALFDPKKLDSYPTLPGVYLMKNVQGSVLYVGKAKNLRQRVKQYFIPGRDGRLMVPYLVAKVSDVETIVVTSEKEALLLENNLIKQHQPTYNALLKDDKAYIALKINTKQLWPILQLVRYKGKPKPDGLYFGPYTSATAARETFDLLSRLFPLRQCSDQEFISRKRPCLLYDIKRCIAPCVNRCTKEEYDRHVQRTIKFLRGQDREVLQDLYKDMHEAAESLDFEKASDVLRVIRQIERTIEGQKVDIPLGADADALGIFRQGEDVILSQLIFRGGKLQGSRHYDFTHIVEDDAELLSSFLLQHYTDKLEMPHEILLPIDLSEKIELQEIITAGKKRKADVYAPLRGHKKALVGMAYTNAEMTFRTRKDEKVIREKMLLEMQQKFSLKHYPARIECFDNSNLAGMEQVSTMVAFVDGQKETGRYRKYKLTTAAASDDYAAMREVLTRRYKRAQEENDLPDLVIIDGGKGHLNIALKVLEELNVIAVDVIGLAKEKGRHDKGATEEQVFLPGIKDPIILRRTSPILFLLQQIRDEAHRTAISFQRKRRDKKVLQSTLEEIEGVGPVKRKILLKHFGGLNGVLEADAEALRLVKGLSEGNIAAILRFIASKKAAKEDA